MSSENTTVDCAGDCATESGPSVTDSSMSDEYFSAYDNLDVHELMLKDKPRTLAYKNFIEQNADLLRNKIVMDVGAGTGILSMFAAKAGAKQVYAVEASNISSVCQELVNHNDLGDKVKVLQGRVEDIALPDNVKVDVIVSEWMGFYLLHESMLSSVVVARDRWLKPDGIVLPSMASLYLCPVSMKQHHKDTFQYWQDVYGFDFSPVLPAVKARQLSQPVITNLKPDQLLAVPELVTHLNLLFLGMDELENIISSFTFTCTKNDVLHGFACWFSVDFDGPSPVTLSTGPESEPTHWKQTVVMLPYPLLVCKGEQVACTLSVVKNTNNPRWYNISIELPEDESDSPEEDEEQESERGQVTVRDMLINAMDTTDGDCNHVS